MKFLNNLFNNYDEFRIFSLSYKAAENYLFKTQIEIMEDMLIQHRKREEKYKEAIEYFSSISPNTINDFIKRKLNE